MTTSETKKLLDDVGWAILIALQENARLSFAELGRRVGLSAPAVAERVRRLEEAGVITGYRAQVDPARLGLPITVIIQLSQVNRRSTNLLSLLQNRPEILECHNVTGNDCFVIKAALPSMAHLENLLDQLSQFGRTTTSVVLSTPVGARPLCGLQIDSVAAGQNEA